MEINLEKIKIFKDAFKLTDIEFETFVEIAKRLGANPFLKEIYAIKYKDYEGKEQLQIFCGNNFYLKTAQEQQDYNGFQSDAVYSEDEFYLQDGIPVHRSNPLKKRGELLGAWCKVFRKNITHPFCVFVRLSEYNTGRSIWKSKPETMIKKVAEAQCHRKAYMGIFSGTYTEEEWTEPKQMDKQELKQPDQTDKTKIEKNPIQKLVDSIVIAESIERCFKVIFENWNKGHREGRIDDISFNEGCFMIYDRAFNLVKSEEDFKTIEKHLKTYYNTEIIPQEVFQNLNNRLMILQSEFQDSHKENQLL